MSALKSLVWTLSLWVSATSSDAGSLRVAGQRLFVPVQIEGRTVDALLDSGAEMTLLDVAFAERLGLTLTGEDTARGTGGEQPVRFASGVDVSVAGVRLDDLRVAVLDLADVSRRLIGEPLSMVLGRELFDSGRFLIDVENARLERIEADRTPAGTALPLRHHAGIEQIPVVIEGVEAWADFDLGNGSGMLVGRELAERHGWLAEERRMGTRSGGGLGGEVTRELVRLTSVRIAGVELGPVTAAVDDTDRASEANVGVDLLRRFVLTIDFPGNRTWLAPQPRSGSDSKSK